MIAWFKGRDGRVVEVQAAVSWLKLKFPLIGPVNVKGLSDIVNNPIYSTGVGLLHFGVQQQRKDGFVNGAGNGKKQTNATLEKIKGWFQGGV